MKCTYCASEFPDQRKLNHHLYTYHPNEPDLTLTCGIRGCPATYRKFNSLTSHQTRKHKTSDAITPMPSISSAGDESDAVTENFETFVGHDSCTDDDETRNNRNEMRDTDQREGGAAMFVLSLRAKSNMTEKNVGEVIEVTESMLADERRCTIEQISAALKAKGIDLEKEISVEEVCSVSSPFKALKTKYRQDKYFSENFNVLQPEIRHLKRRTKLARAKEDSNRETTIEDDVFAYISPTKLINSVFCDRNVPLDPLFDVCDEDDSVLKGYCDGEQFKDHVFFQAHADALQIIIYYDEVEICNPIGSRAGKHKLGMFYMTFANVKPKYRSKLKSIHLVAIVNVNIMKECGVDEILNIIVEDLKLLELGFVLSNGKTIHGCLIAFIGDNLGLHFIAGLKEGFTAFRLCRICFLPIDLIRTKCCEDPSSLRTRQQFDAQVRYIEAATDSETRQALSKDFGINRRCALNSLTYYHTIGGLPLECMHDFLEGVLPLTFQLLLRKVILKDKVITLEGFNSMVTEFDYGYSEENKPAKIKPQHLAEGGSLSQSASQMWLLSNILPLLIGDLFDEEDPYWENFIYLLEAASLVFAHKITREMVEYLHYVIELYLFTFQKLYERNLTPKQHFMTHYPRMIVQLGPIIHFWVMRQEAKHQYFKRVMRTINNWKNVPLSLANQHELTQSWNYLAPIPESLKVGEPIETAVVSLACPDIFRELETVFVAPWIKVDGTKFVSNECYVAIKQKINQVLPQFALLKEIVFSSNDKEPIFVCLSVKTVGRNIHLAAYEIERGIQYQKLTLEDIDLLSVYHAHKVGQSKFIVVRQSICDLY